MADSSEAPGCLARMKSYVRTRKGKILASEIIISLVVLICYAASVYGGYTFVPIFAMVFSIIFFGIFMMEMEKQITFVHWPWTDFLRTAVDSLLYLIISLLAVIGGMGDGPRIAGGVFGFIAAILFGYDAYLVFKEIKGTRHAAAPTSDENA